MLRKWRTNPSALDSVLSYSAFRETIPAREASEYTLSNPTDLYSVYTVLHIENKQAELRWSPQGAFYYFLVQWRQAVAANGAARQAMVPEGDEDPPPQVGAGGGAWGGGPSDRAFGAACCSPSDHAATAADHS